MESDRHHFNTKKKETIDNARFVAFDTETTGFDIKEDRVLSIGAVSFIGKSIEVNKSFELYIQQDVFKPETVKIHGLMKTGNLKKVTELEALKAFLDYIKDSKAVSYFIKEIHKRIFSIKTSGNKTFLELFKNTSD